MIATSCRRRSWFLGCWLKIIADPIRRERAEKSMTTDIAPDVPPSGTGCVECLAADGWWFHLRRCATCGHIGCCDSSPSQHATAHYRSTGHSVITSFEPSEDWFYDFETEQMLPPVELVGPLEHPLDQPAPGPAGAVPPDWESRLNL
jgi:hypothetical protein